MHPPFIFPDLLVAIILFFFFIQPFTCQEVTNYEACKTPSRCHNMDIRYPFLVSGRPSYCGYQSLFLDCEGNKSDIWYRSEWYQVKSISYADRLVTLVDKDVLRLDGCPTSSSYQSIATEYSPQFTPGSSSIFLLTGCPQRPENTTYAYFSDADFYEICPGVGNVANYSYWALDDPRYFKVRTTAWARGLGCSNLVKVGLTAAALNRLNRFDRDYNSSAIRDVMREGVQYVWRHGEGWCFGCENSGGVCGFHPGDLYEVNQPTCLCPYGSESSFCLPG